MKLLLTIVGLGLAIAVLTWGISAILDYRRRKLDEKVFDIREYRRRSKR